MKWTLDDPQLTAYALGELSGEEFQNVEAFVKSSKEARDHVEAIRTTAHLLAGALKSEPLSKLDDKKHAEILNAVTEEPARQQLKTSINWRFLWPLAPLATAALVGFFVYPVIRDLELGREPVREEEAMVPSVPLPVASETVTQKNETAPTQTQTKSAVAPSSDVVAHVAPQKVARAGKVIGYGGAETQSKPQSGIGNTAMVGLTGAVPAKKILATGYVGDVDVSKPALPFPQEGNHKTENYSRINENEFVRVSEHPFSTFSIDVDTASYSNVRRFLMSGVLPPVDAVRIEEMVNYFPYDYSGPKDGKPFSVQVEQASAPWMNEHRLIRVALKGKEYATAQRPKSNLVFLIDVSGSMDEPTKLPLLKNALKAMIEKLTDNDRVAIVVYAGASGLVLPSTSHKSEMIAALERLDAGGSTNGAQGIELAYRVAQENFISGGTNRVILATDGDFNVGVTSEGELTRLIEEKAKSKIFLTVLGFGGGNLKDATLEKLADKGNGDYAYIDTQREANKALVEEMGGTLVTIAKDVKIQIEFNPKQVGAYRLIGYENRRLETEDFNNDAKDAGEVGAGHTVTVLYEIIPAGQTLSGTSVDVLKYQKADTSQSATSLGSDELMTVKVRYKQPEGEKSALIEIPVPMQKRSFDAATADFKFASSVAEFGMLLRDSKFKAASDFNHVIRIAESNLKRNGKVDPYRKEFVDLVQTAQRLKRKSLNPED